jgi:hypothetical protein
LSFWTCRFESGYLYVTQIKHSFRTLDRVKYMGNKGIVVQFDANTVIVTLTGPFLYGTKSFKVSAKEFKELKKS